MYLGHVYLVEDNESLRANLRDLLVFAGYRVREWSNAQDFLSDLPNDAPAVVVSDMLMPGMSGVEMHKALIQRGRMMPVIYISGESSVPQSIEAMKLGALDFLVKPFSREELLRGVAQGIEKDTQLMRSMIEKSRFNESLRQLSPRECQVHTLLLKGMNNAEIMTQLHISLPTAKQYKSEVMRKLGVRSLAQLIALSGPLRENQS
jgi:two-component system, LuxR family, response regulator FixJ